MVWLKMTAVPRLNGPPLKDPHVTPRGTYAALALGSLVELIRSAVRCLFACLVSLSCCFISSKWNQKAVESMKNTIAFTLFVPLFLLGIATPKNIDVITH